MPAFKLSLPGLSIGIGRSSGSQRFRSAAQAKPVQERDPLPPILALEGTPDPSLRKVVEEAAERLGAAVCAVESVAALARDPDLDAVVGLVLTVARCPRDLSRAVEDARKVLGDRPVVAFGPQPLFASPIGSMPVDPSFVAPPVTVERLLFALDFGPGSRV